MCDDPNNNGVAGGGPLINKLRPIPAGAGLQMDTRWECWATIERNGLPNGYYLVQLLYVLPQPHFGTSSVTTIVVAYFGPGSAHADVYSRAGIPDGSEPHACPVPDFETEPVVMSIIPVLTISPLPTDTKGPINRLRPIPAGSSPNQRDYMWYCDACIAAPAHPGTYSFNLVYSVNHGGVSTVTAPVTLTFAQGVSSLQVYNLSGSANTTADHDCDESYIDCVPAY